MNYPVNRESAVAESRSKEIHELALEQLSEGYMLCRHRREPAVKQAGYTMYPLSARHTPRSKVVPHEILILCLYVSYLHKDFFC